MTGGVCGGCKADAGVGRVCEGGGVDGDGFNGGDNDSRVV